MPSKTQREARKTRLMPKGTPRWVRIYDNEGETADRFTIVFTGNYKKYGCNYRTQYLCLSDNPFHPCGIYIREGASFAIDYMKHKWGSVKIGAKHPSMGRRINFADLNKDCQKAVREHYKEIWDI